MVELSIGSILVRLSSLSHRCRHYPQANARLRLVFSMFIGFCVQGFFPATDQLVAREIMTFQAANVTFEAASMTFEAVSMTSQAALRL